MAVFSTDLSSTIETLLENKRYNSVKDILVTVNPQDIAVIFSDQPPARLILLFRLLPKELAAEVFVEMDPELQEQLINAFSDKELEELMSELYMDDTVDLIEEMPANVVKRILKQTDPKMRGKINELLNYPEDSAGSIMTIEFADLRSGMTASEALERIRTTGIDKETIDICYVTEKRKLLGAVSLRSLVLAEGDSAVSEIMDENVIYANTLDDIEAVADMFAKYDLTALPVVDKEQRLVGIITVDDAIDVMRDETTEDMAKMAAVTPSDKPYPKMSVFELYKSRIIWLMLLMISAALTQLVINKFQGALESMIILAAFIPMLMDTGGNAGSQSSATVIRSLSLNEIAFPDILKVIWKEIRVAALCGLTLGVMNFAKLYFIDKVGIAIAAAVSITLVATVIVSKFFGCTLPLIVKKIGLDPAVTASPMITTIVDVTSLIIYFLIASAMLGIGI